MNSFVVKSSKGSLKKSAKTNIILPMIRGQVGREVITRGEIGKMS